MALEVAYLSNSERIERLAISSSMVSMLSFFDADLSQNQAKELLPFIFNS